MQKKKRKSKFVNLFSPEGQEKLVAKLPGRLPCDCEASEHSLIANCLNCGRIVCSQEGSGPCFTCSNLVCTREERELINSKSKAGIKLLEKLIGSLSLADIKTTLDVNQSVDNDALSSAVSHKNKLLEYDQTCAQRTKVIDDQSDYFSHKNPWLSKEERMKIKKLEDEARSLKHNPRAHKKFTFDFAGRKVEEEQIPDPLENIEEKVSRILRKPPDSYQSGDQKLESDSYLVNPNLPTKLKALPVFVPCSSKIDSNEQLVGEVRDKQRVNRLQDADLCEMSDEGMCLSVRQPYASLLIEGIKKHEGRSWYSQHRGRLWIHAGAKPPSPEDVASVEQFYLNYLGEGVHFPEDYPLGCIIGYLNVVDCLGRDEYVEQYPDGESDSEFVFICENPVKLAIKLPMMGQPKIFQLEKYLHRGLKKLPVVTR